MKIAFLCSSLRPACDGVGDYTRSLSAALAELGHDVLRISLNESSSISDPPSVEENTLRLSATISWEGRLAQAGEAVREFSPDWVSLQFVPYGFHPKGIVLGLIERLVMLLGGRRCHVMFHELWIGESTEYGFKDRTVGFVQKWAVIQLLRRLQPALVHTSNPAYREVLRRNGIDASELPLPGNIPISEPTSPVLNAIIHSHGDEKRDVLWIAGVFGTIHPQWSPIQFLDELCALARRKGKRLIFVHLGRTPDAGVGVWRSLTARYADHGDFLMLGPQSSESLSTLFQGLDFGIATSPWAIIGKSGSAAAMLDHGLPVVVTRDDWRLRSGSTPEPSPHLLLFKAGDEFLEKLQSGLPRLPARSRWPATARRFMDDLLATETVGDLLPIEPPSAVENSSGT